jgi:hypothetical protein
MSSSGKSKSAVHLRILRKRAMLTVQRLLGTIEIHKRRKDLASSGGVSPFTGSDDPKLERLRLGIGPENVRALHALRLIRKRSINNEVEAGDAREMIRRIKLERLNMKELLTRKSMWKSGVGSRSVATVSRDAKEMNNVMEGIIENKPESPRPVVTFLWRKELK